MAPLLFTTHELLLSLLVLVGGFLIISVFMLRRDRQAWLPTPFLAFMTVWGFESMTRAVGFHDSAHSRATHQVALVWGLAAALALLSFALRERFKHFPRRVFRLAYVVIPPVAGLLLLITMALSYGSASAIQAVTPFGDAGASSPTRTFVPTWSPMAFGGAAAFRIGCLVFSMVLLRKWALPSPGESSHNPRSLMLALVTGFVAFEWVATFADDLLGPSVPADGVKVFWSLASFLAVLTGIVVLAIARRRESAPIAYVAVPGLIGSLLGLSTGLSWMLGQVGVPVFQFFFAVGSLVAWRWRSLGGLRPALENLGWAAASLAILGLVVGLVSLLNDNPVLAAAGGTVVVVVMAFVRQLLVGLMRKRNRSNSAAPAA